jgi:tetratricopeptide (TPR) repeat protein
MKTHHASSIQPIKKNYIRMKKYILLCLLLASISVSFAQKKSKGIKYTKEEKAELARAEFLFDERNYILALPIYLKLSKSHPEDIYVTYKTGICYLYKNDEREKALDYLQKAYDNEPNLDNILFYIGKAYAARYQFEEAIEYYKKYINTKLSQEQINDAKKHINWAENGLKLYGKEVDVEIKNIGEPINTEFSEYVPVISSDEAVLIFTYRGERSKGGRQNKYLKPDPDGLYYEDIFISYKVGDKWLTPESIGDNINTNDHDAAIALSPDGQMLFIYKSTPKDQGDIYVSYLNGEEWSTPVSLGPNINTNKWEGSCSISSDGRTLYFSSERPGGYGGKDIYKSVKLANGEWGPAENLGPTINTPYNDDAPFIHPDNISLFFSSEGHNSMGGYDIFVSTFENNKWTEPVNLGYPLNTIGDDIYYVLSADGSKGYYASTRPEGYGQQDIYTVIPGLMPRKPVLALVIGTVTVDNKPVEANIKVSNATTGEEISTFKSNAATGKYLLTLTPGNKYKIAFEVEGFDDHIEYVDVNSLEAYVQVAKDFHFYTEEFNGEKKIAVSQSNDEIQKQIEREIEKYKQESSREYLEQIAYNKILKEKGDERKEGVSYFVDLGSIPTNDEKRFNEINRIAPVKKEISFDGKSRITAGPFKTLLEAEIYRLKFVQNDPQLKDAVVRVNDNGQVKSLKKYYPEYYAKSLLVDEPVAQVSKVEFKTNDDEEEEEDDNKPVQKQTVTQQVVQTKVEDKKPNNNVLPKSKIEKIKDFDKREVEGLIFKVEIASVTDPADFKLQHLEKYGKIQAKKYADGTIKYTMGPFKTLAEAEEFKQMLAEKEPEAKDALVTVFVFGARKTADEYKKECDEEIVFKYAKDFIGKDLNDKAVYNDMLQKLGTFNCSDFVFKVQIGAYRFPKNFKYDKIAAKHGPAEVKEYPDGITRFTMKSFKNIAEAEVFRQEMIKMGIKDAWITAEYKGERKLLDELFRNNFYLTKQGL